MNPERVHRAGPILEPAYGYADESGAPHRPSLREALSEWVDSCDFVRDRTRAATAVCLAFHLLTAGCLVAFVMRFLSVGSLVFFVASAVLVVTTYNTVWYHRYCSHRAFEFSDVRWTWLFLWTNPLFFREEGYLFAHRQHHALSDQAGDPYGPHLGRLGSYLAIEWMQSYDVGMSREKHALLAGSLDHLALTLNDYEGFRREGSFEKLSAFAARTLFAQALWALPIYWLGGVPYLVAWAASLFAVMAAMRDFNYAGHVKPVRSGRAPGGPRTGALNQKLYGWFGAEWHENHHRFPRSASNGFEPGQVDLAFRIIQGLQRLGVVESVRDARPDARRARAVADQSSVSEDRIQAAP